MKKRTLIMSGIVLTVAVITGATAMAAGGNFRFTEGNDGGEPPEIVRPVNGLEPRLGPGLGLSVDVTLTEEQKAEALKQMKERLDEQVTAGKLTQEQADAVYDACKDGEFAVTCRPSGELKQIFGDGPAISEERKAGILTHMKEMLDRFVAEGRLTQEEADAMYEKAQNGEEISFSIDGDNGGGCGFRIGRPDRGFRTLPEDIVTSATGVSIT